MGEVRIGDEWMGVRTYPGVGSKWLERLCGVEMSHITSEGF